MSRSLVKLIIVTCLLCGSDAYSQHVTKAKTDSLKSAKAKARKVFMPQVYLSTSDYKDGPIKKDVLAGLLKKGITSRDSLGNTYKVTGFEFAYAERMLYEDSIGNLMVIMDYLTEYCPGDTLSEGVSASIYDRLKYGDTVYFNRVSVYKPGKGNADDNIISGKGIKLYITK